MTAKILPKRIQFFVSSLEGGGAERVATVLCNYWVSCGHVVELVATFSGRGRCVYHLDERVQLRFLSDAVADRKPGLIRNIFRAMALRKMMREFNADSIVTFLTNVNVAILLLSWRLNIPVIVSERSYPAAVPTSKFLSILRRVTYPSASAIVVQTQGALDWLKSVFTKNNGCIIPNPTIFPMSSGERPIMPESFVPPDRLVLLAVGRLSVEKRHKMLLDVFSRISAELPDWDLVVLGDGDERDALEERRAELNLVSRVHFPGYIGNVSDWYSRADIFVMTSAFEGFPNALVEAMAHGLPVVCSDCHAGPRDIIRPSIDGFLVPLESGINGFTVELRKLMKDEACRIQLGLAARQVRERFSLESVGAKWDHLLELVQER